MKKLIGLCVFVVSPVFLSFVLGANETFGISAVKLRYCNGTGAVTKSLFIETKPNKEETLCLEFENEGSKSALIGLNFVDGTLTADSEQKKACLPEGTKEQFGQYVTGYQNTFLVPARAKKRITASLLFPEGYAGTSYGCATYFLADDTGKVLDQRSQGKGGMFKIFTRIGTFVDAFVDGKFNPELIIAPVQGDLFKDEGHNNGLSIYHDGLQYKVRGNLYNTGNIALSGNVHISRSNRWGLFNSYDYYTDQVILPKQSKIIDMSLPWYATRFLGTNTTIDINVDYTPILLGTNNKLDLNKETYHLHSENSKFFFPRCVVFFLIIALIVVIVYKKITNRQEGVKKKKSTYRTRNKKA